MARNAEHIIMTRMGAFPVLLSIDYNHGAEHIMTRMGAFPVLLSIDFNRGRSDPECPELRTRIANVSQCHVPCVSVLSTRRHPAQPVSVPIQQYVPYLTINMSMISSYLISTLRTYVAGSSHPLSLSLPRCARDTFMPTYMYMHT